jgi:hypothetical protein
MAPNHSLNLTTRSAGYLVVARSLFVELLLVKDRSVDLVAS